MPESDAVPVFCNVPLLRTPEVNRNGIAYSRFAITHSL